MLQETELRQAIRDNVWLHFYQMHRAADPDQAPIIVKGDGAKVWDSNGKEYVDALERVGS